MKGLEKQKYVRPVYEKSTKFMNKYPAIADLQS